MSRKSLWPNYLWDWASGLTSQDSRGRLTFAAVATRFSSLLVSDPQTIKEEDDRDLLLELCRDFGAKLGEIAAPSAESFRKNVKKAHTKPDLADLGLPPVALHPFIVGPPITYPCHFFGREQELRRIFGLLNRFPLQNVAVIGLHRSGKTSLLHYLKSITTADRAQLRPGQRTDWLQQPERFNWIFTDFQDARMCKLEGLLRHFLTGLKLPVPDPCNLDNFLEAVSHQVHTPTVILLDEIGAALASPELDQQFWWSLRSLGCNQTDGNLGFILTSHEVPAHLARDHGKPSPFFNIFGHTLTLGPLKDLEARELVASSPKPFYPEDVEWILGQSGLWPSLLQTLCHVRLTALEDGEAGDAWKEEGLRQIAPYEHLL